MVSFISQGEEEIFDSAEFGRAKIVMFGEAEEKYSGEIERRAAMLLKPAFWRVLEAFRERLGPRADGEPGTLAVEWMAEEMAKKARTAAAMK